MTRLLVVLISGVLFLAGCGGSAETSLPPTTGSLTMKFDAPLKVGGKVKAPRARLTITTPDGAQHALVIPNLDAERYEHGVIIAGASNDGHAYMRLDDLGFVMEWSTGPIRDLPPASSTGATGTPAELDHAGF